MQVNFAAAGFGWLVLAGIRGEREMKSGSPSGEPSPSRFFLSDYFVKDFQQQAWPFP
jgi:hypothetical protein